MNRRYSNEEKWEAIASKWKVDKTLLNPDGSRLYPPGVVQDPDGIRSLLELFSMGANQDPKMMAYERHFLALVTAFQAVASMGRKEDMRVQVTNPSRNEFFLVSAWWGRTAIGHGMNWEFLTDELDGWGTEQAIFIGSIMFEFGARIGRHQKGLVGQFVSINAYQVDKDERKAKRKKK
jgi:hypothetical protein